MMRSIAVINQKGGVGKTTTAVNLSAAIAAAGHRVCVIDLDPQAHASLHLGVTLEEDELSVYDVLTGRARLDQVRRSLGDHLALVPAHLNLAAAEMELADQAGRELILREQLSRDTESFDYVILDCPPSLGILTLNALTAVQEVFLPLQPHFLALHGLSKLLQTIQLVAARLNPELRLSGVVMCMYEAGTRLAGEVCGDVETFLHAQSQSTNCWAKAKVFQARIRRNIRLAEAPSFGQSIFQYAPKSHGAEDYQRLAEELMEMELVQCRRRVTPAAA